VIFLGLAGIVDPPREEVVDAIAVCSAAGIRVKMITGDHADTARAIGKELGIGDGEMALTGNELDDMTDEQFYAAACKYDIFARTSPEHKLKLVKALQAHGAICAMTGDGVNDAPALRRADVGVAMGIKGTEVTKDAAEVVLADDNFSTIAAAVEEGRRVYDNLKKTILFILPTNGAESFLIIASILFGTMIPLTPVQILWVNMVTSVTISLALAFEPAEPGVMARPPRNPADPLLSRYFLWRILFVSVLIGGLTLYLSVTVQFGLWAREDPHCDLVDHCAVSGVSPLQQPQHPPVGVGSRSSGKQSGFRGVRPDAAASALSHLSAVHE
jgi:magnesium-transporting ATPase (P-type)